MTTEKEPCNFTGSYVSGWGEAEDEHSDDLKLHGSDSETHGWAIRLNHRAWVDTDEHICKHMTNFTADDQGFRYCDLPRAIEGLNEAGFSGVTICLDCAIEEAKQMEVSK